MPFEKELKSLSEMLMDSDIEKYYRTIRNTDRDVKNPGSEYYFWRSPHYPDQLYIMEYNRVIMWPERVDEVKAEIAKRVRQKALDNASAERETIRNMVTVDWGDYWD